MQKKKGQAALEFLMTYGWAILIVLVILASLFFLGVFNSKTTNVCQIPAPFICQDVKAGSGGINIILSAQNINTARVNNIKVNSQTCTDFQGSNIINNNRKTEIRCVGINLDKKERFNAEINIIYTSNIGNLEHNVKGSASGTSEEFNLVINGGFEEGVGLGFTPNGWTAGIQSDENVKEGMYSLKFSAPTDVFQSTSNLIKVDPNKQYRYEYDIKVNVTVPRFYIEYVCYDINKNPPPCPSGNGLGSCYGQSLKQYNSNFEGRETLDLTNLVTTCPNAAYLLLDYEWWNSIGGDSGTTWTDNVKFIQV